MLPEFGDETLTTACLQWTAIANGPFQISCSGTPPNREPFNPFNESLSSCAAMEPRVGGIGQAPNASAGMERKENGILTTCLWRMWW